MQPYPGPGPRQQISPAGGVMPAWNGNGRELFFGIPGAAGPTVTRMMAVPVRLDPTFHVTGPPTPMFEGVYANSPSRSYDVTRDGQRFLMMDDIPWPASPMTQITLVHGLPLRATSTHTSVP